MFVGHYEPDGRVETLNYLARQGVPVRLYGSLWERASLDPALRQSPIGAAYGEDYVRLIAGAKLALVFLSGRNRDVYTRRCFEIPACGAAMVAPRTKELQAMYREGEEAVYFDSKEELLAKVRWLLDDDEARNRIAKAGRERCLQDGHSNVHRGAQIIEALKGRGRLKQKNPQPRRQSPLPGESHVPAPVLGGRLGRGSRGRLGSVPTSYDALSPSRVQGAQPPPGVQRESPCTQKRWRVGRWDNGARQARPSADGGRRPSQNHPSPSAGGRRSPEAPANTPIAKYERVCYSTP